MTPAVLCRTLSRASRASSRFTENKTAMTTTVPNNLALAMPSFHANATSRRPLITISLSCVIQ